MMKKKKQNLFKKYRKEALILATGSSLVIILLFNLQAPNAKRDIFSKSVNPQKDFVKNRTQQAATKVEEEQEQQSVLLSKFKKDYSAFAKTKRCLKSQNCLYATADLNEYNLAVNQDIAVKLQALKPQLVSNWFRLSSKVKNEMISSIKIEDPFVKEQVLDLLINLEVDESRGYLPLVLEHVIDHHKLELMPQAFEYLKKSTNPENEVQIAKRVAAAIASGAPHASQAMSRELSTIISPNTAEIFKEALSSLSEHASENDFTTSTTTEFALRGSGS